MTLILRPYQVKAVDDVRAEYLKGKRAPVLVMPTGAGKCLGLGTLVLLFDGTIAAVEDVRVGDRLMGPDSNPRLVLSTTRGRGELHRIIPAKGEPWVCNDVHVLTLVHTETGSVVDINIQSYLRESKNYRHLHKQFTPEQGIDFLPASTLPLDPYFLGVWYGDGTKALHGVEISKPDPEILAICHAVANQYGLSVKTGTVQPGRCPTHRIVGIRGEGNPLLTLLRSIVGDGLSLPHSYLTASRAERLSFLAGLLDTDGYMHRSGFDIVQKQRGFADGICFLARSLGLRALLSAKIVNGDTYWRVSISGDCSVIPNRIARKKAPPRKQIKCATRTGFTVESIGPGDYAGFELDGDGRFLLGDFTVTHNTQVAAFIIRSALERGNRTLFAAGRTELLDQTVDKLKNAGVTSVRVIQASRDVGPKDAEVTVASIQTLTTKKWMANLPQAELVILDECHHGSAATWSKVLNAYPNSRRLGLTATPERADGKPLGDLFDSLVTGPSTRDLMDLGHLVECIVFPPAGGEKLDPTEIALDPVEAYRKHGNGERAIVFCLTRIHAQRTEAEFLAAGIECAVVDGTMGKTQRRDTLRRFRCGEIRVLSSVGVLTEGWDDPGCSVAILLRGYGHPGLFIQCAGRILRPHPGKQHARLIDLVGSVWDHGTPDAERTYSLDGAAITKVVREQIKQCQSCGAVFRSNQRCPNCGTEQPAMPFTPPTNTNVGLVELRGPVAPPPKRDYVKTITASWPGRCESCRGIINVGDEILWTTVTKRTKHTACSGALG